MAASGRRNFGFELHWTRCEVGQDTGNGLLCRVQRHNLLDVGFELSASNSPAQHVSQARYSTMLSRIVLCHECRVRGPLYRANCVRPSAGCRQCQLFSHRHPPDAPAATLNLGSFDGVIDSRNRTSVPRHSLPETYHREDTWVVFRTFAHPEARES
jgi:hypothetical protein